MQLRELFIALGVLTGWTGNHWYDCVLALLQATEMETETSTFFQLNEPASKVFGTLKKLGVPRPPKVFGITKADKTG